MVWPYGEESTRNCMHCKTAIMDSKAKAYCSEGKRLSKIRYDKLYGRSLKEVLHLRGWVSDTSKYCVLFEHDVLPVE